MSSHRSSSTLVTSSLLAIAAASLAACSATPPTAKPVLQDDLKVKVAEARVSAPPSIIFRAGDTYASAFRSLGLMDGANYIVDGDSTLALPGSSTPILNSADVIGYFSAYGQTATFEPVDGTKYVRVKIVRNPGLSKAKATTKKCNVTLAGTVPMGTIVTTIAHQAGLEVSYADVGAASYSGVMYPVSFKGSCAGALEYMARKADLAVGFNDSGVEFRMMDMAAVDIGIPLRDRKIALDILADGRIAGSNSSSTNTSQQQGSTFSGNGGNASSSGGSKSMQSSYTTNYLASVKSILDSTRTPFGTWHYVPETGQVFIRDRAEAVAATKSNLNRMAQAFYGKYEVTLTLYRMTSTKDRQVSGNIAHMINSDLAMTFGSSASALVKSTVGLNFDNTATGGKTKSVIQLLSEFGSIETLDTFSLTLQSGIPQTLKVANNTEYIRNVSTTTTGTAGATTSSIEQANATDGSFVTMQARQAEVGKIAVDFGAFINRLDGFDTTQTASSTVKSQRGFERTFDTMAVVDDGIPYVASIVSQKTRTDNTATIPGFEGASGPFSFMIPAVAGSKSDTTGQTYIVVMIEARKQ